MCLLGEGMGSGDGGDEVEGAESTQRPALLTSIPINCRFYWRVILVIQLLSNAIYSRRAKAGYSANLIT